MKLPISFIESTRALMGALHFCIRTGVNLGRFNLHMSKKISNVMKINICTEMCIRDSPIFYIQHTICKIVKVVKAVFCDQNCFALLFPETQDLSLIHISAYGRHSFVEGIRNGGLDVLKTAAVP